MEWKLWSLEEKQRDKIVTVYEYFKEWNTAELHNEDERNFYSSLHTPSPHEPSIFSPIVFTH